jgi:hypothetical protein
MDLTISVDEKLVARARRNAEAMGTSLNRLLIDAIQKLADAEESESITRKNKERAGRAHSGGWGYASD